MLKLNCKSTSRSEATLHKHIKQLVYKIDPIREDEDEYDSNATSFEKEVKWIQLYWEKKWKQELYPQENNNSSSLHTLLHIGWVNHAKSFNTRVTLMSQSPTPKNVRAHQENLDFLNALGQLRIDIIQQLQIAAHAYEVDRVGRCDIIYSTATGSTNPTSDYDVSYLAHPEAASHRVMYLTFTAFYTIWGVTLADAFDSNLYSGSWAFIPTRLVHDDIKVRTELGKRTLHHTSQRTSTPKRSSQRTSSSLLESPGDSNPSSNNKYKTESKTTSLSSSEEDDMYQIIIPDIPGFEKPLPLLVFHTDTRSFEQQLKYLMVKLCRIKGYKAARNSIQHSLLLRGKEMNKPL